MRLPWPRLWTCAHRHHVLALVDGAQSRGDTLGLAWPAALIFYALPAKNGCAVPKVWARCMSARIVFRACFGRNVCGFFPRRRGGGLRLTGYFMPPRGRRRLRSGQYLPPGIKAMAANLVWLEQTIGWEWIYARRSKKHLAAYAARR